MKQEKIIKSYSTSERSAVFSSLMTKVYLWMTMGLGMTALAAAYVAQSPSMLQTLYSGATIYILLFAEIALVWYMSARIMKMSFATAGIIFAIYSLINGVTLSGLVLAYAAEDITAAFLATAGTFGAMTFVGLFIKRDLSAMGRIGMMAVIGLIIATIVNMFVASSILYWGITYLGVIIFTGLTAYDTQKIKQMFIQYGDEVNENTMKLALMGSLTLYLDFINLFLYLLRIFGGERE